MIIISLSLLCLSGKSLECPSTILETGVEAGEERVEKEKRRKRMVLIIAATNRKLAQAEVLKLQNYHWPGNVREFQNIIERAVISSRCGSVKFDLPVPQASGVSPKTLIKKNGDNPVEILTEEDMRLREKTNIEAALNQTGWKIYGKGGAAELLGIKPTTLSPASKKWRLRKVVKLGGKWG